MVFGLLPITQKILFWVLIIVLVWGVNFTFWGLIGLIRLVSDKLHSSKLHWERRTTKGKTNIKISDVAIIVPAHNEELVIADTLRSLSNLISVKNIYVVSDGSSDKTVEIVDNFGANVLNLKISHGKAGALEACLKNFNLLQKYKAVLFVDADTRLKSDYLEKALPFFSDPEVISVAGFAKTIWDPKKMSWVQLLFVSYRDRLYFFNQLLVKFGQTWRHTNVTPIIPGFASVYRSSALKQMTLNPAGLVIEDFNMTFEVHHKRLGRIAHHPSVVAFTQDPDNQHDYYRQVKRWDLGLWQTIRLHGIWRSKFWFAMSITLIEVILSSIMFLILPVLLIIFFIPHLIIGVFHFWLLALFLGIFISDYSLTFVAAMIQRRPQYIILGFLFPFMHIYDALAFLGAIPKAYLTKSNGQWVSPTRRSS
ncbi:MAG TPA: glycosyltransferase family 2 protein [Patescibacteria group bacterium]|nr:glycosyltransferase family 2 protein [Patescibacteria group bacterium]